VDAAKTAMIHASFPMRAQAHRSMVAALAIGRGGAEMKAGEGRRPRGQGASDQEKPW